MLSELLKVQLNSDLIGPFLLYSYNYRGMLTTIYDKTRVDDGEIYWLEGFETIRATGEYTFTLPAERGKEIHLFAFFKNKYRNIFSESRFLGTVAKET